MKKIKSINYKVLFLIIIFFIIVISLSVLVFKFTFKTNNHSVKTKNKWIVAEEKYDYYNNNYLNRYKEYSKSNPDLKVEDVITRVNIGLDKDFYSNTKKSLYLNKEYILVNKYYYLDKDYVPDNLVDVDLKYSRSGMRLVDYANDAYIKMCQDAQNDGFKIMATSSYRSYDYQVSLYNNYASSDGVDAADTYSARAGFSEHQTGLSVDVYDGDTSYTNFENTASFTWMSNNSYKYGFILRFPKDKQNITGYNYESWHYRYVGKKIAKYIHENNITFDEYYIKRIENKK